MQCAHQQLVRDSPELRDGQKAIPAGHSRENLRNRVESLWLVGARTASDDALRETKAM